MNVVDHVYLVGSGSNGFGISHPCDSHVWAIDAGPDDTVLIDAGSGADPRPIADRIIRHGLGGRRVTILLTHAHADHAGGAGPLGRLLGAQVAASPEVSDIVNAADETRAGLEVGKRAGTYPRDYALPPGRVHRELADGQVLSVGDAAITVVTTPGHATGHLCFLVERGARRDLFTGDALLFGGKIILQSTWDCRLEEQIDSLRKLAAHEFEGLFPGHFSFSVADGRRHLDAALAPLDLGGIPPLL
jgi:hydroxyacylglutathione hydrolase